MSSLGEGGSAAEWDTRKDAEAPQHLDIGGVRLEDDRSTERKKKRNNRTGRAKKKVTGFEGKVSIPSGEDVVSIGSCHYP